MSYEAWGEPDGSPFDAAAEAGWIDPTDLSQALIDVMNERDRQWNEEGWTLGHDDQHTDGSLAIVASCYAESAAKPGFFAAAPGGARTLPLRWPATWAREWFKPKDPRRDLVRAAALILAEIERIDRAEARAKAEASHAEA